MLRDLLWRRAGVPTTAEEPQPVQPAPVDDTAERALAELVEHQAQLAETAQAIAGGNLAREVVVGADDDALGAAFREMLAGLRRLVGQVKTPLLMSTPGRRQPPSRSARQTRAFCHCATLSKASRAAPMSN